MSSLTTRVRDLVFQDSEKPKRAVRHQNSWHVFSNAVKMYCATHHPKVKLSTTIISNLWKLVKPEHGTLFKQIALQRNKGIYSTELVTAINYESYLQQFGLLL